MLADLLAPLDYPRRSAYNLARSGGNVFSGDASWQDLLRALPAAGGLAATPFLGPLGGAGVAAGLQGLGGLVAPEAFAAPTAADLVEGLNGDPESLLQTLAAQLATDPLTYAGGVGAVRAGRAASGQAKAAFAPPSFRPGGPPGGVPGTMPMQLGSGPPLSPKLLPPELAGYPEFGAPKVPWAHGLGEGPLPAVGPAVGTPENLAQAHGAIEADAALQAAREAEALAPPFPGPADAPWVSPRPPASPMEEAAATHGVLHDLIMDVRSGDVPRDPTSMQTLAKMGTEAAERELSLISGDILRITTPPEVLGNLYHARNMGAAGRRMAAHGTLHGYGPENPSGLRMAQEFGRTERRADEALGHLLNPYEPEALGGGGMWGGVGPVDLEPAGVGRAYQMAYGGQLPARKLGPLMRGLEALGLPADRGRMLENYLGSIKSLEDTSVPMPLDVMNTLGRGRDSAEARRLIYNATHQLSSSRGLEAQRLYRSALLEALARGGVEVPRELLLPPNLL